MLSKRQTRSLIALVVALAVAGVTWIGGFGDDGGGGAPPNGSSASEFQLPDPAQETPDSGLPTIAESELPPEGRETLELIRAGGPYPYDRDGLTFQNREGFLPDRDRGYYHEFTVPTPGEDDRGARRIVAGEDGDLYYTADHYQSFHQIEGGT